MRAKARREPTQIAVAGLNPHASENGMFGKKTDTSLFRNLQARVDAIEASGPWPGDTVSCAKARRNFASW